MIGSMLVTYAKGIAVLAKVAAAGLALVASPSLSAESGQGTDARGSGAHVAAAATPAHGASDAHATPAHGRSGDAAPHATATPTDAGSGHAPAGHGAADGAEGGTHDAPHGKGGGDHAAPSDHGDGHGSPAHGDASAGHGGGHDEHAEPPTWGPVKWGLGLGIWHFLNFVILFGAIFWLTRKALAGAVRSKRAATVKGIEEATKLRDEMRAKFDEYDQRMRNIDERMNAMIGDARAEAELEKTKLVTEATALAARMREDAKQIADQEIARARRELQDEQIARAAELAEKILEANVTKEDQQRLADEFMARVAGHPGKEGRA